MKQISITDITIKQSGKSAGYLLSFREKIEIAKLLDRLGVDVIELHAMENQKIDSLLIKSIASAVKESTIAVPVGLTAEGVFPVWNALHEAKRPRLQVPAPLSAVQMEYLAGKKPEAILNAIDETISACCRLCPDVEFIAEDATRAEPDFLAQAIRRAITAGASTVTICDSAGTMLPSEFGAVISELKENVPALSSIHLGISCSNTLSMADACAMSAIHCGAVEVKTAANCVNTVNLENLARLIAARGSDLNMTCSIRITQIKRILSQIIWMCQSSRSKTSPFDNGVRDNSGVFLTAHDNREAVAKVVSSLGYDLSDEDTERVYEAFARIAARKETVGTRELDAIVASAALQVPSTFRLESYVINTGNLISATAHLRLDKNGQSLEGVCIGDGPIDAALLAIEQIIGQHYELDDFQIQAVTEGREAMGETIVKLRSEGKLYSGRGISTDIVGASIHAYLNALNKIVYEDISK